MHSNKILFVLIGILFLFISLCSGKTIHHEVNHTFETTQETATGFLILNENSSHLMTKREFGRECTLCKHETVCCAPRVCMRKFHERECVESYERRGRWGWNRF